MDVVPVTWTAIQTAVTYLGSAVMVSAAILLWIYRELNNLRAMISDFRVQVARDYVNITALHALEDRLDKVIERVDRALELAIEARKNKANGQSGRDKTSS